MTRLARSASLLIVAALALGALHCSAATGSGPLAKILKIPAARATQTNAAPPASVLKCPPLPKWVLDAKLAAKPLDQRLLRGALPPKVDYSQYVTFVRCQDGAGGCFLYAALAVIDILKEMEHPYTPDLSYRYCQYYYDTKGVEQKKVHTDYGSCPEGVLHSDYDGVVWTGDRFDESQCPMPTHEDDIQARRYRIEDTSEYITPTISGLKSLLVDKGPLWASGTISGQPHCVAIVGYDNALNAFRFLNSWGDRWNGDGYGLIPYGQLSQMLDAVTYFTNRPTERVGTTDAYTARIRLRQANLRNELTVAVGIERLKPDIVWDRPNETGPPQDYNKDLDIDVPLPKYAATYWPPSQNYPWYVQITDHNKDGNSVVVEEFTLTRVFKGALGKYLTEVHRPHMATFTIPDGGHRKIYVGRQAPKTELTLTPGQASISSGGSAVLSGTLSVSSYDTDGPPTVTPLAGKEIKINSVLSIDTVEQSQWQQVGTAVTDAKGNFTFTVKPAATTSYVAAYTRPDGQIIAQSSQCKVTLGPVKMGPIRKPVPVLRPH